MNTIVYHWFSGDTGKFGKPKEAQTNPDSYDVGKISRCPIIASIATLRAVDSQSKIIVLNASDPKSKEKQNWEQYEELLNFKVHGIEAHLEEHYSNKPGYGHLSRLFDINRFDWGDNQRILYSDSDVFWTKPPFPTAKNLNRFCFDGYNTGIFYFGKSCDDVRKFFELFEAYTISALNNDQIRTQMKQYVGYDAWYYVWDEMITTYMFQEHKDLFHQIPKTEHCCARDLEFIDPQLIKAFHCNGLMVQNLVTKEKHARGIAAIVVKEWWDAINKVMDPTMIFSQEDIDRHLPLQFSLLNEPERITSTQADDGHFWLT